MQRAYLEPLVDDNHTFDEELHAHQERTGPPAETNAVDADDFDF